MRRSSESRALRPSCERRRGKMMDGKEMRLLEVESRARKWISKSVTIGADRVLILRGYGASDSSKITYTRQVRRVGNKVKECSLENHTGIPQL